MATTLKIEFRRLAHGGRGHRLHEGDLGVTRHKPSGSHKTAQIGFSFTKQTLEKLGWMYGDYITADFERDGSIGKWLLSRVAGSKHAIAISRRTNSGTASARFSKEDSVLDFVFPPGESRVACELIEHAKNTATFVFDFDDAR
jgi:hypothetical protein